jgi:hypothetical protein
MDSIYLEKLPDYMLGINLNYKVINNIEWYHVSSKECKAETGKHKGKILKVGMRLRELVGEFQIRVVDGSICFGELVFTAITIKDDNNPLWVYYNECNQLFGDPLDPMWERVKRLLGMRNSILKADDSRYRMRLEIRYWNIPMKSPIDSEVLKIMVIRDDNPQYLINWWKEVKMLLDCEVDSLYKKGKSFWVNYEKNNLFPPVLIGLANFGLALKQIEGVISKS